MRRHPAQFLAPGQQFGSADSLEHNAGSGAEYGSADSLEHRATPSGLEPECGWASGSAGIVRELLRHVRIVDGGDPSYAVAWPDQPVARAQATDPIRASAGRDVAS